VNYFCCRDDDDINDVATMGGVNLSEETKNILAAVPESAAQLRSCRDDAFLSHTPLAHKIRQLGFYPYIIFIFCQTSSIVISIQI